MNEDSDMLFGKIARSLDLVNKNQVEECVRIQEKLPEERPLGEILLERGYIDEADLSRIIRKQREKLRKKGRVNRRLREDKRYGKLVRRFGFVSQVQLNEALRVQATFQEQENRIVPLGEILMDRDYLTEEQHQTILDYQRDNVLRCPHCSTEFDVAMYCPGSSISCYSCEKGIVEVPDISDVS